jgi:hypothetical protein
MIVDDCLPSLVFSDEQGWAAAPAKFRSAARHQADPADEGAGPVAGMVFAQLRG